MHSAEKMYFVYIVCNPAKTTLYIGVTNNLPARVIEHWENRGMSETFAGRYFCYNLLYYETYQFIQIAISRETELKKWSRIKKEALINEKNPEWVFLNNKLCGEWPPKKFARRF